MSAARDTGPTGSRPRLTMLPASAVLDDVVARHAGLFVSTGARASLQNAPYQAEPLHFKGQLAGWHPGNRGALGSFGQIHDAAARTGARAGSVQFQGVTAGTAGSVQCQLASLGLLRERSSLYFGSPRQFFGLGSHRQGRSWLPISQLTVHGFCRAPKLVKPCWVRVRKCSRLLTGWLLATGFQSGGPSVCSAWAPAQLIPVPGL